MLLRLNDTTCHSWQTADSAFSTATSSFCHKYLTCHLFTQQLSASRYWGICPYTDLLRHAMLFYCQAGICLGLSETVVSSLGELFSRNLVRKAPPEEKIPPVLRQMGQSPSGSICLSILTGGGVSAMPNACCCRPSWKLQQAPRYLQSPGPALLSQGRKWSIRENEELRSAAQEALCCWPASPSVWLSTHLNNTTSVIIKVLWCCFNEPFPSTSVLLFILGRKKS